MFTEQIKRHILKKLLQKGFDITYNELNPFEKANVHLIPVRYVTPFNIDQARRFLSGDRSDELENCLSDAYAVHYFFGGWRKGEK